MLTSQQSAIIAKAPNRSESLAVNAVAGSGKCLGKGTPVLLANGQILPVESIQPGMYLAGPQEPRLVLLTTKGESPLVKIVPVKGEPWVCNTDHILTLAGTNRFTGLTIDISVKDYWAQCAQKSSFASSWKLLRSGISYWPEADLPIPPYFFGLWLGDGHTNNTKLTTADQPIINYVYRIAADLGYRVKQTNTHSSIPGQQFNPNCWDLQLYPIASDGKPWSNQLRQFLRGTTSAGYKNIPLQYLTASVNQRRKLLAGVIDTDGSYSGNCFDLISKDQFLADDYCFLARSLGLAAYKTTKFVNNTPYYRVSISGDIHLIPTKLSRKQANPRQQIKRVTVTGFTVVPVGTGEYFGFTLDGDGRFLLGDFTVTHNTFTLREFASATTGTGLATSFSKATTEELAAKMPPRIKAQTQHSIGFEAIRGRGGRAKIVKDKVYTIAAQLFKDLPQEDAEDLERDAFGSVLRLVDLAKTYGLVPKAQGTGFLPDNEDSWYSLADSYDIDVDELVLELAHQALTLSNERALAADPEVDFSDMLYIPMCWKYKFPYYGLIILDEAQDLSSIQHEMVGRILRPGGRLIMAGDPHQAIYAFRGALSDSYSRLITRFNATEMPLTFSFRCPQAVVAEAQRFVPHIQASPDAIVGSVETWDACSLWDLPTTILCRNNAPLVSLALRLITAGRSAEVAGADIGRGLINLIKKITKKNLKSTAFVDRLLGWSQREIQRKPQNTHRITDKRDAIMAIAAIKPDRDSIIAHLERLYPDPKSKDYRPAEIHLSSIHKAKGLEWDQVAILDPQLMPSKYATKAEERQQEQNLSYVAVTRAKRDLRYINSDCIE